jgi:hypothetical protein
MEFGGVEERLLTDEEKQEFRDFEETFRTPGWERIKRDITKEVQESPAQLFWDVTSWEDLVLHRARLSNLMRLAQYEELLDQQKEGIIRNRLDLIDEAQAGSIAHE